MALQRLVITQRFLFFLLELLSLSDDASSLAPTTELFFLLEFLSLFDDASSLAPMAELHKALSTSEGVNTSSFALNSYTIQKHTLNSGIPKCSYSFISCFLRRA